MIKIFIAIVVVGTLLWFFPEIKAHLSSIRRSSKKESRLSEVKNEYDDLKVEEKVVGVREDIKEKAKSVKERVRALEVEDEE